MVQTTVYPLRTLPLPPSSLILLSAPEQGLWAVLTTNTEQGVLVLDARAAEQRVLFSKLCGAFEVWAVIALGVGRWTAPRTHPTSNWAL